ncbi:MAG TPA: hypothetical protein VML55_20115 [Planctomycetaceae bacterium]|nr:hypothetical protein [Planctomycetaceae bacterium]
MRLDSLRRVSIAFAALAALLLVAGCGGEKGKDSAYKPADRSPPEVPEPAGHPEEGTHGGHLYDLGRHQFFAELTFDPSTRNITIYVVEHDDINKPAAMDAEGARLLLEAAGPDGGEQEVNLLLTARPQEGDPEGQASQFELAGDQLPAEIKGEEQLHGVLHFTRDGKIYDAHLEPHEHDDEGRRTDAGHDDHDHPSPEGGK